jgi:hypothetical protein
MSTSSGYQAIFAEFVERVKDSDAQWYSIKHLQPDIPSLADLLGVTADNLETLIVKFGLGKSAKHNNLVSFQASKFESFRSAFTIQELCETTQGKVKGRKTKEWFVRLGTNYIGDLAVPGSTKGRARLTNICAIRQEFKEAIAKLKIRQQAEEADPGEEEVEGSKEDETEEEGIHDPNENDFLLLQVQRVLLPLLMKEEILPSSRHCTYHKS